MANSFLFILFKQEIEYNLEKKQNKLGRYCVHECCIKGMMNYSYLNSIRFLSISLLNKKRNFYRYKIGNVKMLRGLLKYINDINTLDKNLQNAAHICAKHGELECLRLLTANGIDLRHKDALGMEPSHVAAYYNHARVIDFLFEMGVPLTEYCAGGKAPIHYACENGSLDVIRSINSYIPDISIPEKHEANTGAHLAARYDKLDCLKLLASLGLPLNLVTNDLGRNIAHMCCLYGSLKSLHWLLENFSFDVFSVDSKKLEYTFFCKIATLY